MDGNTGHPTDDLDLEWSPRRRSNEPSRRRGSSSRSRKGSGSQGRGRQRAERGSARPGARQPAAERTKKARAKRKKTLVGRIFKIIVLVVLLIIVIAAVAAGVAYARLSKQLPDPAQQMKGRDQTSRIYDRDNHLLAKLHAEQDRTDIALDKMPKELRDAVIAVEDERYYEHQGVDPLGIARALYVDLRAGEARQGASTITQQWVRNAFFTQEKTAKRKAMEAMLAYKVEKRYSKDEILEMYLNTIYFGHGAYGVEAASQTYFGKRASKLTLEESALIAGVLNSPGNYSPYVEPEAAKARRDLVLDKMIELGYITKAQHVDAVKSPVETAGLKPKSTRAPYFVEYVRTQLVKEYGSEAVYRGGLTVKTTIDLKLQSAAEKAIKSTLDRKDDPSASIVAVDPDTGQILAMVGGKNFKKQQYNIAAQGHRQPGSAFKPFVLATALKDGISPEQPYKPNSMSLKIPGGQVWRVSGHSGGPMRLREATEKSVNAVFAQLILEVGPEKVAKLAGDMGIRTDLTPVPAIALGGLKEGVTPLEMTSAYATLAANGSYRRPYSISSVRDHTGKYLLRRKPTSKRALDSDVAALTTDILTGVIERGTGTSADIGRPAAGKTGTTQEYRDAWFVGYTPDLAAGVWVGYPREQKEMKSVHGIQVTGGSFPAEIWAKFMKEALKGKPEKKFRKPKGLVKIKVCTVSGMKATEFCPKTMSGLFFKEKVPDTCDVHTAPQEIEIPNVVGMTKNAAIAALKKLHFLFKVLEKSVSGVPTGYVSSQSPKGGSRATTDTVVTIVVSKGGGAKSMPPTAIFDFKPSSPSSGKAVTFDASASTDDGKIVTWFWEFGDSEQGNGQKVTHTYSAPGTYDVKLWVTDDHGQVSSVSKKVLVK